jgi:hypothetical protein
LVDHFGHFAFQLCFFCLFLSCLLELALLYLVVFLQFCRPDVIFLKRSVKEPGSEVEAFLEVGTVLLCLEFCSFVELVSQLEQGFGEAVDGIGLVAFDLFFGIGPDLFGFFDVFRESNSHLVNFVVSFLVELLLFFELR